MKYLLKNGIIFDGFKLNFFKKDILLNGEKIELIKDVIDIETEYEIINCENKIISSGFIDCHSHNDFFNYKDLKYFDCFINQGITTQIAGNCGFSYYGDDTCKYENLVGGNLFSIDNATSFKEYADNLSSLYVNMAFLVGHGSLRTFIKGYEGTSLNHDQTKKLIELTRNNLNQGCIGGSLGLMYEPGIYANNAELIAFAKEIKKQDKILTIHPKANSDISLAYPLFKRKHIKLGLMECIEIMKETNVNLQYSHLIFVGKKSWKSVKKILRIIDTYNLKGFNFNFDIYPYSFGASVITVFCPPWYMSLSKEKRNSKSVKFKVKFMISITKTLLGLKYQDLMISYISEDEKYKKFEGKNLKEIAKDFNMSCIDTYIELINVSNGKAKILLNKYSNDTILKQMMNSKHSMFMTDGWYEEKGYQNESIYNSFPLFLKKNYEFNLDLSATLYKMTKKISDKYKLENRGDLKEGYFADITIFDYEEIKTIMDYKKLFEAIVYVFINGTLVKKDGKINDIKKGKIIITKNLV